MFWASTPRQDWTELGLRARRRHAAWLTRALRLATPLPRIPVRPVSAGGFEPILAKPEGRAWAESFWSGVFDHPDLDLAAER
ncbi:MAG TPA: hypothetical protein VD963_05845 [Phycisphaerales bacterium]|nr:hypothetical protein [Phycisphaerales bacterium]